MQLDCALVTDLITIVHQSSDGRVNFVIATIAGVMISIGLTGFLFTDAIAIAIAVRGIGIGGDGVILQRILGMVVVVEAVVVVVVVLMVVVVKVMVVVIGCRLVMVIN